MIAALTLLSIVPTDPIEAVCTLEYGVRDRGGPQWVIAHCPTDIAHAGELQSAVNAALERVPLGRWGRRIAFRLADEIVFEFDNDDGGWNALPGQNFIWTEAQPSPRLPERGYLSVGCSYGAQIGTDGVPRDVEVYCLLDGERPLSLTRITEDDVIAAVENMRFVPTAFEYCFTDQSVITISRMLVGDPRSAETGDARGYLDQLPPFCDQSS